MLLSLSPVDTSFPLQEDKELLCAAHLGVLTWPKRTHIFAQEQIPANLVGRDGISLEGDAMQASLSQVLQYFPCRELCQLTYEDLSPTLNMPI
jgi:hypothetical protein